MRRRFVAPAALATLWVIAGAVIHWPVYAQGDAAASRAELDDVKARRKEAEAAAADTQKLRAEADKALKAAEQAVSRSKRKLRELQTAQSRVKATLEAVRADQAKTRADIEAGREALARWLKRYYQHGGEPGVGHMLSARDPNQLARDAYYLERIGREKQAIVERLRVSEAQFADQAAQIELKQTELEANEHKQKLQTAELAKEQARRSKLLAELSATLKAQQAQIGALKEDESKLMALIRQLETAPPPRPRVPRAEPADEPDVGRSGRAADASSRGMAFARLRGQLRLPVEGRLMGRFGQERASTGTSWKGVFIRSRAGDDVRAVADGQVVYSDWLRGFGNLVIVDHGDNYLTVYGNNEALFKSTGERVLAGDVIASVGDSGGIPESGLYFEIRHEGRPVDPLTWVRRD